jgi:hypothetical protein
MGKFTLARLNVQLKIIFVIGYGFTSASERSVLIDGRGEASDTD